MLVVFVVAARLGLEPRYTGPTRFLRSEATIKIEMPLW